MYSQAARVVGKRVLVKKTGSMVAADPTDKNGRKKSLISMRPGDFV